MNAKRILGVGVVAVVAALAATGLWMSRGRDALLIVRESRPEAVMGTRTHLLAVVEADRDEEADEALQAAENELRNVELQMSRRIELSDVSKFNAAPAGQLVELAPQTVEVLRASRRLWEQSDGAFDVTIRPLILLWMQAGQDGAPPTAERLAAARDESRWPDMELRDGGAVKRKATAAVDLGGIAKGYGIDRAAEALRRAGCLGGLVDVGGDIRCFGRRRDGGAWHVAVRNPFRPETDAPLTLLAISDGAVCTSGNYERFTEIAGKRYSHILDPRTGLPADAAPSVTVVAPTATLADGWATALSVLGPEGLALLPRGAGVEAMIVAGTSDHYTIHATVGLRGLLVEPPAGVQWHGAPSRLPAGGR